MVVRTPNIQSIGFLCITLLVSIGHSFSVLFICRNRKKRCYLVCVVNLPIFQTALKDCDMSSGMAIICTICAHLSKLW